jgi:hypothetical protein
MKLRTKRNPVNIKQEKIEVDFILDTKRIRSKHGSSKSSEHFLEENLNKNKFIEKREDVQTQNISASEITSQSNTDASENIEHMDLGVKQEGTGKAEASLNANSGN